MMKPVLALCMITLSSCSSLYEGLTRRDYSNVLRQGVSRAEIHRRLGAPEAVRDFTVPTVCPLGYGSLSRRKLSVSRIDSWSIDGYTRLTTQPRGSFGSLAGFLGEEFTLGPLILFHWSSAQRKARYKLHVAYTRGDYYLRHSRVLMDTNSLKNYSPQEE
jgi:hypothetical protein